MKNYIKLSVKKAKELASLLTQADGKDTIEFEDKDGTRFLIEIQYGDSLHDKNCRTNCGRALVGDEPACTCKPHQCEGWGCGEKSQEKIPSKHEFMTTKKFHCNNCWHINMAYSTSMDYCKEEKCGCHKAQTCTSKASEWPGITIEEKGSVSDRIFEKTESHEQVHESWEEEFNPLLFQEREGGRYYTNIGKLKDYIRKTNQQVREAERKRILQKLPREIFYTNTDYFIEGFNKCLEEVKKIVND